MPGNGSIWVITGWARKRGNRYLRGDGEASHIFPIHCREILVHSWMNFCLWRIVAAQHWQLMQHHVLFSSLWPCIRNMETYKINEWRIQSILQFPDVVAAVWQVHLVFKDVLLAYDNMDSNTFVCPPFKAKRKCLKASHLTVSKPTLLYYPSPCCLFLADRLHSSQPRTRHLNRLSIHKAVEIVCE